MKTVMLMAMAMILTTGVLVGEAAEQPPPVPAEEQPEVLTRGPVNEAFAQPVDLEDQAGVVAPKAPPPDIEEVPPPERPAGRQFAWVPGYWAWDSERDAYIWVSGCWRAVPPGMSWVPGYWSETPEGWQWVPGFWAPAGSREIAYLPPPPELTDIEPPAPPSPDRIWVPPCWYWNRGRYVFRPGYWIAAQPDWVWMPSHYVWTPRGYVFVMGHWDYALDRRGVLFAPVYFPHRVYARPGFTYSLSIAVDLGNLQFALFTRPSYCHYYFGDYYDRIYIGLGIFPWFEVERHHSWYDPIYVHNRWRRHRHEPGWEQHERREYERRRTDRTLRPPRTYDEMVRRTSRMPASQRRDFEIAAPVTQVAARGKTTGFKWQPTKPETQRQLSKHSNDVQQFVRERSRWESQGVGRRAGQPPMKGGESGQHQSAAPPSAPKGRQITSPEPKEAMPAPQRPHDGRTQGGGWSGSWPGGEAQKQPQERPSQPERYGPDTVKMRTPPVADRQGSGDRHRRMPAWPPEERRKP